MNFFAKLRSKLKEVEDVKEVKAKDVEPKFSITETESPKIDFEVTEISLEEYARFPTKERRTKVRKSKET